MTIGLDGPDLSTIIDDTGHLHLFSDSQKSVHLANFLGLDLEAFSLELALGTLEPQMLNFLEVFPSLLETLPFFGKGILLKDISFLSSR